MIVVKHEMLDREISVEREMGRFGNHATGPTIIIFAGIHGNESSGIFASKYLLEQLNKIEPEFKGCLIALAGNEQALNCGKRYIVEDLNRIWHADVIHKIKDNGFELDNCEAELKEQILLFETIERIFKEYNPPYYFIDLHTTSSDSVPFITINDTIRNRNFALKFPLPVILGIEEFLPGTMLSYINQLGPIAIGFEAGKHEMPSSIDNHISCLWLALEATGCMHRKDIPDFQQHFDRLKVQSTDSQKVFEIRFRHQRTETEDFKMDPGYENFHPVKKGQHLARNKHGELLAPESGRIFLPLYQNLGDDGFFIIREIKLIWLKVSAKLRYYNAERFIRHLPGMHQSREDVHTFRVYYMIARWLIKDFFHLLGFRRSLRSGKYQYFTRRKFDVVEPQSYNVNRVNKNL